jgi:hypothetical protein
MLREIEDLIRICERERQINDLSGSALVEEKSYSKYS